MLHLADVYCMNLQINCSSFMWTKLDYSFEIDSIEMNSTTISKNRQNSVVNSVATRFVSFEND